MKIKKKKKIRGIQLFLVLFTTFVVGGAIGISTIVHINATAVSNFDINELTADYTTKSGDGGSASYNNNTITMTAKTKESTDWCGDPTFTSCTNTLTLKVKEGHSGTVAFKTSFNGGGSFSHNPSDNTIHLNASESITFTLKSSDSGADTSTGYISDINFTEDSNITVSFISAENGSYTLQLNGQTYSIPKTFENVPSTNKYNVSANPASGYKFYGWLDDNTQEFVSMNSSDTLLLFKDSIIKPVFVLSAMPIFEVFNTYFMDLNEANEFATEHGNIINLFSDGELGEGEYTISAGNTLLIPFDASKTLYTTKPVVVYNSYTPPTPYKTLTLLSGSNLIVNGSLSLSAKLAAIGQTEGKNGITSGNYGCIRFLHSNKTLSNPTIDVKTGANLYVWGYIHGDGNVLARKGSTVYECFEIRDWRGGNATLSKRSYSFPFNQYHIQNIESKFFLYNGAVEKLYSSVNASISAYPVSVDFIGSNRSMFRFADSSSDAEYFLKYYDSSTDQLFIECHTNASLSSITVGGLPMIGSISSEQYKLPITNNISVTIISGFTVSVTAQDFMMLPGSELNIQNGGRLDILNGAGLYLIDVDDWCGRQLAGSKTMDYIPSAYSPTRASGTKYNVSDKDAKLKVNGLFYIYGDLYVSAGGANICCDDGVIGKLAFQNGTISTDPQPLYEMESTTTQREITMTIAKFKNSDDTYLDYSEYLSREGVDTEKMQMIDYSDENGAWKWDGKSSAGITTTIRYTDPLYPSFKPIEIEMLSSDSYTFFTSETILQYLEDNYQGEYPSGIFQRGNKKIQYWEIGLTNVYMKAGFTQDPIGVLAETLIPIYEGWIDDDGINKYLLPTSGDITVSNFATGLYYAPTFVPGSSEEHIFKFTGEGILDNTFTGLYNYVNESGITNGDGQTYYVVNGVVQENYGLYYDDLGSYYYFGEANYAYKNGIYYVSNTNELTYDDDPIEPGYYYFDSNGVMDVTHAHVEPKSRPTSINGGVAYDQNGDTADNYGLFALNSYLYYVAENGVLITSTSFYVSADMINGCTIGNNGVSAGLYYFDEQGRMYDSQLNLITNGGQS